MYSLAPLLTCLAPLLAFRQEPGPDAPTLDSSLLAVDGAVAVQDVHPLLTLANIRLAAPQVPAAGNNAGAQLSAYLDQARRAAVGKVLAAFAARKQLAGAGPTVLADVPLTSQSGEYRRKVIKQGRFVGLALQVQPGRDVQVVVSGLGTQFTEPNPDFRLYLYHSSSLSPVADYDVPRTTRVSFEWTPLTVTLPAALSGGEYRLGYFEDDLVGQAIDLQNDFSRRPCQSCTNDYLNFDQWAPLVAVRAFALPSTAGTDVLPDFRPTYYDDSNFGLNLRLSATCDLSDYFCRYKAQFAEALQLQLALDLLQAMANTTRNNGIGQQVQVLALKEVNHQPGHESGLLLRYQAALAALNVDLSGVSPRCLPCAAKPGAVRVGVV